MAKKKPKTLRQIRPNAGVQAWYEKQLDKEIERMNRSVLYWLSAEYKKTGMAYDANPAIMMRVILNKLRRRWESTFTRLANRLARRFANKVLRSTDAAFKGALRKQDMTVEFQMTESMRTKYEAVVSENVGLIKSIPEHQLNQVETLVMISVSRGRDVGWLTDQLEERFGVTRRRAAFIALDQSQKATSIINAQRQRDLGITKGIWKHSGAGKEPRQSHIAADGKEFDLDKGMYIDGDWIMPAQLPRCRCSWVAVLPTLD